MYSKWLLITLLCWLGSLRLEAQFIENKGQWPQQVAFRTDLPAGALWVENDAFTWQFYDPAILDYLHPVTGVSDPSPICRQHAYRVSFLNHTHPELLGKNAITPYYNYYLDQDPSKWATFCKSFQRVDYSQVYPGIDLVLYTKNNAVKYDFIVHPGVDPDPIALRFDGDVGLQLIDGNLRIHTSVNTLTELAPYAYQLIEGQLHEVEVSFVLQDNVLSFSIGQYDPNYSLVIDPEIAFSTYIGSSASNFGFTACDDNLGNLISGANVYSSGYPITLGAYQIDFSTGGSNVFDAAISKFDNTGSNLLYSTYLGGGRQDAPHSIVADGNDNFIVMGVTGSTNFPTTASAYQPAFAGGAYLDMNASNFFTGVQDQGTDIFVTKFNPDGTLSASTFIGGTNNDGLNYANELFYNYGDAFRGEVNIDENNNIFVASVTRSTDFPTLSGFQNGYGGGDSDGVIFCLNENLTNLIWSSFAGGSGNDACYAVEFNNSGIIILAGGTQSDDFPMNGSGDDTSWNGNTDGFIALIHPISHNLQTSTYLGTTEYDQVYFVQTDADDNVYVYGQTAGNMPITSGCYGQANSGQFIRKYSANLGSMNWNTTIGTGSGEIDISPTAFLVSDCDQIYISGWGGQVNTYCQLVYDCYAQYSTTEGLPITSDAFQPTTDGSDFYLCVLSPEAQSLVYGSYLGGTESSEHVDGGTSRFDKNGSVYQAVCAGCQGNSDFPTTPNAWSNDNPSFGCNIAVFRFDLGTVNAEVEIDGPDEVCEGSPVSFNNLSSGASDYIWYFGDGSSSEEFEPTHTYEDNGEFTITLIGLDNADCLEGDTTTITITVLPGVNPTIDAIEPVCLGQSVQLNAIGSDNLFWLDNPTLSDTAIPNPIATPTDATTYYAVDFNSCETDTVSIQIELFTPDTDISDNVTICLGDNTQLAASGGVEYDWSPGIGLNQTDIANPIASPLQTTTYTVDITTAEGCQVTEDVVVTVIASAPGGQIYPDVQLCKGSSVTLMAQDGNFWQWSPSNSLSNSTIQNPVASPLATTTYSVLITNPCGSGTDQITVHVVVPEVTASEGATICYGSTFAASATGAITYAWEPSEWAFPPFEASTSLAPLSSTWFVVTGIDENNCIDTDSLYMGVLDQPQVDAGPDQYFDYPGSAQLFGNAFGLNYYWWPSEGLSCTDCPYPVASPQSPTVYYLFVTDGFGCSAKDSVFVKPYFPIWVPNTITPNNDGINDVFRAYGENIEGFSMKIFDRWGVKIFESSDIEDVWLGGVSELYYVQNDTYVWVIEYDTLERREKLVGHVNVIR